MYTKHPILKDINGAGIYSINDIAKNGWFYWLKGTPDSVRKTIKRYCELDLSRGEDSILRPTLRGEGNGARWYIKGENIIKFVIQYEDGGIIN